jgi:hypothetical protein
MKHNILADNNALRINLSLLMLFCFAIPAPTSIGAVDYFTPPVYSDIAMTLIAGYAMAIPLVMFFQRYVIRVARFAIALRLLLALILLLPMPLGVVTVAYGALLLCDALMIGLEICIAACLFSKETLIKALCMTQFIRMGFIVILDTWLPMSLTIFSIYVVVASVAWSYFYWKLPNVWIRYVKREDGLVPPRKMFVAICFLFAFNVCVRMFGQNFAINTGNYDIIYIAATLSAAIFFLLWRHAGISPFRLLGAIILLSLVGFVCALLSAYLPLTVFACILMGLGMINLIINAYYAMFLLECYPSRFVLPALCLITIAVVAQTGLLWNFSPSDTQLRYGLYLLIVVMFAVLYLIMQPYIIHSFNKKPEGEPSAKLEPSDKTTRLVESAFDKLSGQELRLAELSCRAIPTPRSRRY